jgi:flagellar biosynthesis protein FlhB
VSDKTEQPTARRLRRAREEGDSGASAYAAQAVSFVATVAVVPFAVRALVLRTTEDLRLALAAASHRGAWDIVAGGFSGPTLALAVVELVLPVLVAAGLVGGAAFVLQTGGVMAASQVAPSLERLDPVAGIARLFSRARLFTILRALLAGVAVGALA